MSVSNKKLSEKADYALSDFAAGGKLPEESFMRFYQVALKQNKMSSMIRAVAMNGPDLRVPKLLWEGQVMRAGQDGVALPEDARVKPTNSSVLLSSKQGKAEVNLERSILEDNVERGNFQNTLVDFFGRKVSNDIENVIINGDTASGNDWLALQDGIIKATTSNLETTGGDCDPGMLNDLDSLLPEEFENQPGLAFWTNKYAYKNYLHEIGERETNLGDSVLTAGRKVGPGYDGLPLNRVPFFPKTLGMGSDETVVMLLDPKNWLFGMQRKVTLEWEVDIRAQMVVFVITLRFAQAYEHEPAAAKATGVNGQ